MPSYHCLFVDHGDNIFSEDTFDAKSDESAIEFARHVYDNGIGKGFLLLQGDRLIHQHTHADQRITEMGAGGRISSKVAA